MCGYRRAATCGITSIRFGRGATAPQRKGQQAKVHAAEQGKGEWVWKLDADMHHGRVRVTGARGGMQAAGASRSRYPKQRSRAVAAITSGPQRSKKYRRGPENTQKGKYNQ